MRYSFLTTGHEVYDDRIFYHHAMSLKKNGDNVQIISSMKTEKTIINTIQIIGFDGKYLAKKEKIETFINLLCEFKPDTIICSEPLAVFAAHKFKKKYKTGPIIIYDITEWYPSKKNLGGYNSTIYKIFIFLKLLVFNFYVASLCDRFIFGEWYKSLPYRRLFPNKKHCYISYYPDLSYIPKSSSKMKKNVLNLTYSGKISSEKGFGSFLDVIKKLLELNSELKVNFKIIGWYSTDFDKIKFEKAVSELDKRVTVEYHDFQALESYLELIKDTDMFLDLRSTDLENQHCLPIKLFYYIALGKPVIFSDLKAIKKEVHFEKFGFLVNPTDINEVVNCILRYLSNQELYFLHCSNAVEYSKSHYNWRQHEAKFIDFVTP